jgi:hypothetical protein
MWILRTLFAASAALAVGSCTNGGGSATVLFIGTNGTGSCFETIVVVDLEAAGARVSRSRDEHPECRIDTLLEASGCDARFIESNDRDELRIVVDGCTLPATASLASCSFFLGSDTDLTPFVTSSHCACTGDQCFEIPGVCIGVGDDPGDCEHCTNQIDDDDNGQTDCADANCIADPACVEVTTTTSSTSTSNSYFSTRTDPTTTTTQDPFLMECPVTFRLPDELLVGALQWDTYILDPQGYFVSTQGRLDCQDTTDGTLSAFNLASATTLRSGLVSTDGIQGPTDLAECLYRTRVQFPQELPVAGDFELFVLDAADTTSNPIEPFPDVLVSVGECVGVGAD